MRTMIYAGVNKGDHFFPIVNDFDLCIGFEANPELSRLLTETILTRNLKNVEIVSAALCDFDGEVRFHINNDDYTSSMGRINNDVHPSIKTIATITVRAVNLFNFLTARSIGNVDFYLSDLQGMDLTVLRTLKPLLDEKRICQVQCEVGKDDRPHVYVGLYNGFSGFQELLSKNYYIADHKKVEEHFTEDIIWKAKSQAASEEKE